MPRRFCLVPACTSCTTCRRDVLRTSVAKDSSCVVGKSRSPLASLARQALLVIGLEVPAPTQHPRDATMPLRCRPPSWRVPPRLSTPGQGRIVFQLSDVFSGHGALVQS